MSSENLNLPGLNSGHQSDEMIMTDFEMQLLEAVKDKQITEMWLDEHLKKTDVIIDENGDDKELNRLLDKLSSVMAEISRLQVMNDALKKSQSGKEK